MFTFNYAMVDVWVLAGRHLHRVRARRPAFLPLHHAYCPPQPFVFLLALVSSSPCSGARCGYLFSRFLCHPMAQPSVGGT